jgi:hypothetical protein
MMQIIAIVATLNVVMLLRVFHRGRRIHRELSERIAAITISRIRRRRWPQ